MTAPRRLLAVVPALLLCAPLVACARQTPEDAVERQLVAQAALAKAKDALAASRPGDAVGELERALPCADGDSAFLGMLKTAYAAELAGATPERAAVLNARLQLLGKPPQPVSVAVPPPAPASESGAAALKQATALFQKAGTSPEKLSLAAAAFASAFQSVELSGEQHAAWAFCRLRVAQDSLEKGANPDAVRREVEDALKHAPANAELKERAAAILAKLGRPPAAGSANFRVAPSSSPAAASALPFAEAKRRELASRWSPAQSAWNPACELVLHADPASFEAATRQKADALGLATVTLDAGRVTGRRIDLLCPGEWTDACAQALSRELMHVVLADLFPADAPPVWVAVGLAALATSEAEQARYRRALDRLQTEGKALTLDQLVTARRVPASAVTEFHAGSFALVKYLVGWRGEKAFLHAVGLVGRYGATGALKQAYGAEPAALAKAALR